MCVIVCVIVCVFCVFLCVACVGMWGDVIWCGTVGCSGVVLCCVCGCVCGCGCGCGCGCVCGCGCGCVVFGRVVAFVCVGV